MSQSTEKFESRARNQCPAESVCLACSGMMRGGDDEGWHRAWMDAWCNNTMWGQTLSLPVGRHLHPALTKHARTSLWHTFDTTEGLWAIAVGHLRTSFLYTCLMNFSTFSFFLKKKKKKEGEGGWFFSSFAPVGWNGSNKGQWWEWVGGIWGVCTDFWVSVQVGHRKGCISAAELFMLLRYCTPSSNIQ